MDNAFELFLVTSLTVLSVLTHPAVFISIFALFLYADIVERNKKHKKKQRGHYRQRKSKKSFLERIFT